MTSITFLRELDVVVFLALREELPKLVYVPRASLFLPEVRAGVLGTSFGVIGSNVAASLSTDSTVVLEEDGVEGSRG